MRAVMLYEPRDMRLIDMPAPELRPHEALVRIRSVGICGSDLHYYEDGHIGSNRVTEPLVLGHEYAGVVEKVGSSSDSALIGQRVAVEPGVPCSHCEWCVRGDYNVCPDMAFPGGPPHHGALCDYMTVPARLCFPIPDSMGLDEAAAIEPLAVVVHSIELAGLKPWDTVAVLGLGPIGLLTAMTARVCGANVVYGSDLHDYRLDAAKSLGVTASVNAARDSTVDFVLEETKGRGVDVVFDAARSSETISDACRIAAPQGRVILTGISGNESDPLPVSIARRKELTIRWCRRFKHDYPRAIGLATSGQIDLGGIITHSFSLEKSADAFELASRAGDGILKASIDF